MTPEEYVQSKGWKYRLGSGQVQARCPFCGDTNKYGHLYISQEFGAWTCHRCGEKGSFRDLQLRLGDEPEPMWHRAAHVYDVWETLVSISQDALLDNPDAISYLRDERHLSPETIGKYRLGWVPSNVMELMLDEYSLEELRTAGLVTDKNYPLFWDRVLIPYLADDRVIAVRAKQIGGGILQAKESTIRLFGMDDIRKMAEVYVCEGEFDAMVLGQMGYPACAIPGAMSFQEHWVPYFDDARRVFVCMDADEAGVAGAAKIVHIVGAKAKPIALPLPDGATSTDITEFFWRDNHTKDDFDLLVDEVRGQRLFSMVEATASWYQIRSLEGVKLGIKDFDFSIDPGLLPGQVMVLLATTGSGKTAFLTQVIHNLSGWESYDKKQGGGPSHPILMLSLEQTKGEVANRLLRIGRFHNPWASDADITGWHQNFRLVDENRIPSGEVSILLEEFRDEQGCYPELLVIDYLGYWSNSFDKSSRYEQTTAAVHEIKAIAKEYGCSAIVPHQVSRLQKRGDRIDMDHARDAGTIAETGDFVVGLWKPHEKDQDTQETADYRRRADTRLGLGKSRHGNQGRESMLLWAPYSLALIERGSFLEPMVKEEYRRFDEQRTYQEVMEFHQGRRFT